MGEKNLDEMVNDIEAIRDRLADSIDDLAGFMQPAAIASRGAANLKSHFVNEDGSVRLERIVPIVVGAVALIGLGKLGRAIFRD